MALKLVKHEVKKDDKATVYSSRYESGEDFVENVRITVKIEDLHNEAQHAEFKVNAAKCNTAIKLSIETLQQVQQLIEEGWEGDCVG